MEPALKRQRTGRKENDTGEIEGLTEYEIWRKPIPLLGEEEEVSISIRQLNTEFRCPVCLGILHDTHATMECLHRFCLECISKSLRLSKKECPSCRVKCASKRSLRSDSNFDHIIRKIYPNLDEYEAKEAERLLQINELYQLSQLTNTLEEGIKRQALYKKMRNRKPRDAESSVPPKSSGREKDREKDQDKERDKGKEKAKEKEKEKDKETDHGKHGIQTSERAEGTEISLGGNPEAMKLREKSGEEIEFLLVVHPSEKGLPQLEKRYLKTTVSCTVQHLCHYLTTKLGTPATDYRITLSKRGRTFILPRSLPLSDILKSFWKTKADLLLHYSQDSTDLHDHE